MGEKVGTHAAMFRVKIDEKPTYFVMLNSESSAVRAFESETAGVRFFEDAFNEAQRRGYGYAAGAIMNSMQLQPRIFHFGTVDNLRKLFGDIVHPETITATGVYEHTFRCSDQDSAKVIYDAATVPRA